MHGLATARLSSIGRAMALRRDAQQRRCSSRRGKGYEVNCCAVALRSTDRQGKGKAESSGAKQWQCTVKQCEARQRNGREKR